MRVAKSYLIGTRSHRLWLKLCDAEPWWFFSPLYRAYSWMLCKLQGHVVADDQCGKPEHRYCTTCNRLAANQPVTKFAGSRWKSHG